MNEKVKKIIENWEKEAKTYRKLYDEEDIISIVDNKMIDEFFNYMFQFLIGSLKTILLKI